MKIQSWTKGTLLKNFAATPRHNKSHLQTQGVRSKIVNLGTSLGNESYEFARENVQVPIDQD
jgi:hypothetical protein